MNHNKKKLIVFGSSVAFGEGALNNNGWASILSDRLSEDWELINQSVCGNRAKHLLKRVYEDVISLQPTAVIIAISLGNEGLVYPFKKYRYNRFIRGIKQLIEICKLNHNFPIVTNVYPNDYYKEIEYSYMERMNIELDALDVPIINISGTVDDLTGKWIDGLAFDSGHPNDQGHMEMSTAFPSSLFDTLTIDYPVYQFPTQPLDCSSFVGFRFLPATDIRSFTIVLDVKPKTDGLLFSIDDEYSLEWSHGALKCNGAILYTPTEELNTYHITIDYHPFLQNGSIRVECQQVFEFSCQTLTVNDFYFDTAVTEYYSIRLYRGRLSNHIKNHIYNKHPYQSSMEFYATNLYDTSDKGIENGMHNNTTIQVIRENDDTPNK